MTLISLARNPVPGGAETGHLKTRDGVLLRYAVWRATRAPLRGTCVIVQGRTEFIEKYFEVVADLRRRGFAVVAFDLRGQGGSDRQLSDAGKGHIKSFATYDADIETIVRGLVIDKLPAPVIGLGHSLGGNLLLRQASMAQCPFARIVVTAPMIRIADRSLKFPQGFARGITETACAAWLGSLYLPGGDGTPAHMRPFEGNDMTNDRERFMRTRAVLEAAPNLGLGAPTYGWLRAALRAMKRLQSVDAPRAVRVPVMFVTAGADKIVSSTAVEDFALGTKLGSGVLIATSQHEVLQEVDAVRGRFWSAFDAYFTSETLAAS